MAAANSHPEGAARYEAGIWSKRNVRIEFILGRAVFWNLAFRALGGAMGTAIAYVEVPRMLMIRQ